MKPTPYDGLYGQIGVANCRAGYSQDYLLCRTAKVKGELAKFINKDGRVLDVGGGFRIITEFLPDFAKERNYVNLDISIEMLKCSSCYNIPAAAEQIPCPNDSFDYVIPSDVLEHVNSKIKALNECYRVLKPGGLFLLSTPRTGWMISEGALFSPS